ncbi:Hypothetical protein PHPALM_8484 [Phytophthora palmivora]|uniref:Uncharacterized protein n=1 Tax=Phytophthora palmivora TaxID=4796 RepID=A0A2P4Y9Q4_9STRA|nr:Hypothetical protein PHPALM_8484 [Phytophthora palmivora]
MDFKDNMKKLVLYAPQLHFSLRSVPATVKHDFSSSLDRKQCAMQTDQRFIIKAPMAYDADLYQFHAKPSVHASAHIATSNKQRSFLLYTNGLGILTSQAIRGLDDTAYANPKEPFLCTVFKRATVQLEKAHTYIHGPLPVPSLTGCRYFVIFIDDYSRFMFIYPNKNCSQLYECYEDFRKNP